MSRLHPKGPPKTKKGRQTAAKAGSGARNVRGTATYCAPYSFGEQQRPLGPGSPGADAGAAIVTVLSGRVRAASSPTIQLVRCNSSQHVQVGRPPCGPRGCDQAEHGREHEENDKAGDGDHGVRDALLP